MIHRGIVSKVWVTPGGIVGVSYDGKGASLTPRETAKARPKVGDSIIVVTDERNMIQIIILNNRVVRTGEPRIEEWEESK